MAAISPNELPEVCIIAKDLQVDPIRLSPHVSSLA
ncbi:hypothetical protein CBM2626_A260059 [Cupriavidus taiwanensis]|uniref:Uncharacterized protein n=1 Tax=Cupriavidus taiwanensis TaxID=164546 RepID=A0A976G2M4_9BURK|nr:hypothetical protein CBM2614_A340023 [Cupriavidus taiwanensis]SOZ62527.1 hypothetical protein CBM2613_A330027 [Cupriavidus taiwanensis]SOZ99295.1 hypothetical protein CBM2626_A260059 [Cupriavidus taiwanensis]SPA06186.1 hypothetical protein CBM2625_A280026 [Cupriavidus taiwanensis]